MDENPHPNQPSELNRRRFFSRLSILLGSIGAAIVAVPTVGFLLGLRRPTKIWRVVGHVQDFEMGATIQVAFEDPSPLPWSGVTAQTAAWLRRTGEHEFIAFSVDCTHLGCPIRWLPDANLFMCPCHGGVFYADGTVSAGPPPRPLFHYPVRVQGDEVQILTSPLPIA